MDKERISLKSKIILYTMIILLFSITIISGLVMKWAIENVKLKIRINNMNTAISVATAPLIGDALRDEDPDGIIQDYIKNVLEFLEDIDMIVVADMEGKRYGHPDVDRLGEHFVGGDEERTIKTGESYVSEATGTLGASLRTFAPIYDTDSNQVGFVMVGTLIEGIIADQYKVGKKILIYTFGGLILGIIGAISLASNIKESLLGLEPYQITRIYNEKSSMLEAIQEGIIAIDDKARITTINDSALKILGVNYTNVLNMKVKDVFPNSSLERVLATGMKEIEKERILNGINIVTNTIPIKSENTTIGVITTFKDKTEVTRLAEEITGVNEIVDALRSNTHEFMNKLHIILGLIQIGDLEQAKKQIVNIRSQQQHIISLVMDKIEDPMVSALIIGKQSRGRELGIDLLLDEESILKRSHGKIQSNILVTILGNFIENALESISEDNKDDKRVIIKIFENETEIEIEVEDTGKGIKGENLNKIFQLKYSTKSGARGIGLALVKERVENNGGSIVVVSELGKGTKIKAWIPKEDKDG